MASLKPCPFCGETIGMYEDRTDGRMGAHCRKCGVVFTGSLYVSPTLDEVWQSRPIEDDLLAACKLAEKIAVADAEGWQPVYNDDTGEVRFGDPDEYVKALENLEVIRAAIARAEGQA